MIIIYFKLGSTTTMNYLENLTAVLGLIKESFHVFRVVDVVKIDPNPSSSSLSPISEPSKTPSKKPKSYPS